MGADALITKIDTGRKTRAESLRVQITFMDLDEGLIRGQVLSSKGNTSYPVRLNLKKRTCRCECKDFERRLQPCKHLAATAMVVQRIAQGQVINPPVPVPVPAPATAPAPAPVPVPVGPPEQARVISGCAV
jgi:uncharacterized Zn finger protein